MKCILHIGTEKTGTTLLQEWLYANQKQLSKQKVYLSNLLGKPNNRLLPAYFQSQLDDWAKLNKIHNEHDKNIFFKNFENDFAEEIKQASKNHHVFIISSEHFHSRLKVKKDIEKLNTFLRNFFNEIKIICYFREQSDMALSLYSTILKVGSNKSLETFLHNVKPDNYYYNFKAIADNWSELFDKENCNFRIYNRENFVNSDIRRDFLKSIECDIDDTTLNFNIKSRNESLSKLEASFFREINEAIPYWNKTTEKIDPINKKLRQLIGSTKILKHGRLHLENKKEIAESFIEINTDFFDSYFNGRYLFKKVPDEKNIAENLYSLNDIEKICLDLLKVLIPYIVESPSLLDSDAEYLRDIACKYDSQSPLSLSDAEKLMSLAKRARPNGAFILKKLAQYEAKSTNDSTKYLS